MAEIALRIKEFRNQKDKYLAYRPIGSIVIAIDDNTMRRKWLEIVCDLVSPKKRELYRNLPGWQYLCDHWTPELRNTWFEVQRPKQNDAINPLLNNKSLTQGLWDTLVDAQLISLLGKEPRGLINLTDTWLWSEHERKNYFIVCNTDETDYKIVSEYNGFNTGYDEGNAIVYPRAMIDWENDIAGLSAATIANIKDLKVIIHPKFDSPVTKTLIKTPNIVGLRAVIR